MEKISNKRSFVNTPSPEDSLEYEQNPASPDHRAELDEYLRIDVYGLNVINEEILF